MERSSLWPNLRYHLTIFQKGLRKVTKTLVKVACDPAEIQTRCLMNTSHKILYLEKTFLVKAQKETGNTGRFYIMDKMF
jgi:hypothetical protein